LEIEEDGYAIKEQKLITLKPKEPITMEKNEHSFAQVEVAKQRCMCVIDAIHQLPSSSNITHSCKRTLLKLAHSELTFLSRPSSSTPLRFYSLHSYLKFIMIMLVYSSNTSIIQ
jgi:hypothetical protein